jgi:hypothetical protein
MKPIRLAALALVPLMAAGCDVALGVYFATKDSDSKRSPTIPAGPDSTYHVFVKQVAGGDEANQQTALITANGNPAAAGWTPIGSALVTAEFPLPALGTFNAIVVSAGMVNIYNLESIQLLNAAGDVTETASGTTFSNLVNTPNEILGPPNGTVAVTAADATNDAFVFSIYVLGDNPTKVRVNLWATGPSSGDVDRRQFALRGGIQRAGGAALKSDGTLYAMAKDDFGPNRDVLLYKFPASGAVPPTPSLIDSGGNSALGNNTVVISSTDQVYLATTAPGSANPSSVIHLQKFEGTAPLWSQNHGPTGSVNRVEAHGLALDSVGNLVLAGGVDFGVGGIGNYLRKIGPDGSPLWTLPPGAPSPLDANDDYWYAVTSASGDFFATGDLQFNAPTGSIQMFTQQLDGSDGGNGTQRWQDFKDGPNAPNTAPDQGNAIVVNTLGDAFVGGFFGSGGTARNSLIMKYPAGNSPAGATTVFQATANADSEVLGLAIDTTNNAIYATGYETVSLSSTRTHLFVMKFDSSGVLLWKRTYNGGVGDDRGVSLAVNPTVDAGHIYVFGETATAAGNVEVFYLRLVK